MNDSLFVMRVDFFLVLILAAPALAVLVLLFFAGVELAKDIKSVLAFNFLVSDELTVVEGDVW
jgi:hypothetical protein